MSEEVKKQKRNMRRRELYKQKKEEQKEYIKELEENAKKDAEKYGIDLKVFQDYENNMSKEEKQMFKKAFKKHIEIMTSKSYKKNREFLDMFKK